MNTVNGSIALATAHKLRSAAAALVADGESQSDHRLADSLMYEAGEILSRARQIEEQVKPAIEEPTEFGSLVRAPWNGRQRLWVRVQKDYWEDETGIAATWSELRDVEVLRVGVGQTSHPACVDARDVRMLHDRIDKMLREPGDDDRSAAGWTGALRGARTVLHDLATAAEIDAASADEWARLDAANADTDAYAKGAEDAKRDLFNEMAVEQDDERLSYVTIQLNRETWNELKALS